MAITRQKLSGSTNGRGIAVTTGAPATLHTSTTVTGTADEVHVWFVNSGASLTTVTAFMGSTGLGDAIPYELPKNAGLHLVVPGLFLASGLACVAAAGATGVIAYGFANRLTTGA